MTVIDINHDNQLALACAEERPSSFEPTWIIATSESPWQREIFLQQAEGRAATLYGQWVTLAVGHSGPPRPKALLTQLAHALRQRTTDATDLVTLAEATKAEHLRRWIRTHFGTRQPVHVAVNAIGDFSEEALEVVRDTLISVWGTVQLTISASPAALGTASGSTALPDSFSLDEVMEWTNTYPLPSADGDALLAELFPTGVVDVPVDVVYRVATRFLASLESRD